MPPVVPPHLPQSEPPPPAGRRPFRPLPFHKSQIKNGLTVVLAEDHTVPLAHLNCIMPAGAAYEPPAMTGLASLTIPLLRAGTGKRDAAQIDVAAEDLGADLLPYVDWDAGSLAIELLAGDIDLGIELLFDLLWSPAFPEPALGSLRRRHLAKLRQQRWQPAELAGEWFDRALYGDTIYGRALLGSKESLGRIERDDLCDFHRKHFGVRGATLVGIGSFRTEDLIRRLEALPLPDLQGGPPEPPLITPPAPSVTQVCVVNVPDAAQTEIRVGHAGVARGHPDYARLQLLGRVLGDRLLRTLRERRGYTYYVSSRFASRRGHGSLVTAAAVGNDKVGAAVREVLREMENLRQESVSADELADAQNYVTGAFLRSLQSGHERAVQLKQLVVNNLPDDYLLRYLEEIGGASRDDLLSLARRHLRSRPVIIVAVGPAREFSQQLADCGEVLEVEPTRES